jgi:hypothetical protein
MDLAPFAAVNTSIVRHVIPRSAQSAKVDTFWKTTPVTSAAKGSQTAMHAIIYIVLHVIQDFSLSMVLAPIAKISTQIAHYALRQYAQDAKQVTSLRTIYAINAVLQDSKDAPHVTLRVASLAILDFSWKMKLVIIVLQDSPLVSLATQHIAKLVQSAMSLIANF